MFKLPTQPQTIGKTLDVGFRLYASGFKGILPFAVIAALVSSLPNFLMAGMEGAEPADPTAYLTTLFAMIPVLVVVSSALMIAMLASYDAKAKGENLPFGAALKLGLRKLLPVIGAGFLYTIAVLLGLVLLIIPGIILMATFGLAIYGVVLEDLGPMKAIKRSHHLVWPGNWWRSVTVFSVPVFIMLVAGMAIGMPLGIIGALAGDPELMALIMNIGQAIVSVFTTPLMYAVLIALYHDLKLRREGGDLMQRIEAAPVAAAS